eukprot:SAG31_NODE_674_length_12909_cov_25.961124_9_plen_84_part_00
MAGGRGRALSSSSARGAPARDAAAQAAQSPELPPVKTYPDTEYSCELSRYLHSLPHTLPYLIQTGYQKGTKLVLGHEIGTPGP